MDLEQAMLSFPDLLAKYTETNNIQLRRMDELRIFGCFQDVATNGYEDFAFRNGDITLLLNIAKILNAKIKEKDHLFFEFCNPNAECITISTVVGTFYGVDSGLTYENGFAALEGMELLILVVYQSYIGRKRNELIYELIGHYIEYAMRRKGRTIDLYCKRPLIMSIFQVNQTV